MNGDGCGWGERWWRGGDGGFGGKLGKAAERIEEKVKGRMDVDFVWSEGGKVVEKTVREWLGE